VQVVQVVQVAAETEAVQIIPVQQLEQQTPVAVGAVKKALVLIKVLQDQVVAEL
jgi:hypothetical protein